MLRTNKLVLTSLFIACGLLLPLAFHTFGMGGRTFLPMHIPVFMGGLLLGWLPGFIIGALTPLLSCLLTGMPPLIPSLPMMIVELALFGLVAGYLYYDKRQNIYLGKRRKIRFQLFDDGYDLYYREGDRIVYFRGTRYPLCIEAEERGEHICVLCGVRVNEPKHHGEREVDTDRCEACRRSLIKVSELKSK